MLRALVVNSINSTFDLLESDREEPQDGIEIHACDEHNGELCSESANLTEEQTKQDHNALRAQPPSGPGR